MVDFGTILKQLRLSSGLTQKELAEKIGITKSVISYYELQERTPSPEILVKLASIFNVTTDYLLGIERDPGSVWIPPDLWRRIFSFLGIPLNSSERKTVGCSRNKIGRISYPARKHILILFIKAPPKTQKQEAHHARFHGYDMLPVRFCESERLETF